MAVMWKDAPENPNRGKEPKARKPKEPKSKITTTKSKKAEKENASSSDGLMPSSDGDMLHMSDV